MAEEQERPVEPGKVQGEEKGAKSTGSAFRLTVLLCVPFLQQFPPVSSLWFLPTIALSKRECYQCAGSLPGHETSREQPEGCCFYTARETTPNQAVPRQPGLGAAHHAAPLYAL